MHWVNALPDELKLLIFLLLFGSGRSATMDTQTRSPYRLSEDAKPTHYGSFITRHS